MPEKEIGEKELRAMMREEAKAAIKDDKATKLEITPAEEEKEKAVAKSVDDGCKCPACGHTEPGEFNPCPGCGEQMDWS